MQHVNHFEATTTTDPTGEPNGDPDKPVGDGDDSDDDEPKKKLPVTGAQVTTLAALAALLLGSGVYLVNVRRRRGTHGA